VYLTFDLLTSNLIEIFFAPSIVHMCDVVTIGGKDNVLEPGYHIATSMSIALYL
jgi:hypothetical protein